MSIENGESTEEADAVGYKRPPKHSRWKPGTSGNPLGRPRRQEQSKPLPMLGRIGAELILTESTRPMKVRENGKVEVMPTLQAIVRGLHVSALKGDRRAAIAAIRISKAAEEAMDREVTKALDELHQAQRNWDEAVRHAKRNGVPLEEPVPHPYDMAFDYRTMRIITNGPSTSAEKARWDKAVAYRQDTVEEIEDILAYSSGELPDSLSNVLSTLVATVDLIDSRFPSETTRRQPDFSLPEWRAAQKARGTSVQELKRPWDPHYWATVKARREPRARRPSRKRR